MPLVEYIEWEDCYCCPCTDPSGCGCHDPECEDCGGHGERVKSRLTVVMSWLTWWQWLRSQSYPYRSLRNELFGPDWGPCEECGFLGEEHHIYCSKYP